MEKMTIETKKVPVICADQSLAKGAEVFNQNFWSDPSKNIILSCMSEYSVLHYCSKQIAKMCSNSDQLCEKHILNLKKQWKISNFNLNELMFFGQNPEMHIRIQSFLCGVKTLLDYLAQLLTSEKIVGTNIDGFHRKQDNYGGRVLNALNGNARRDRKDEAFRLKSLILRHKETWIDHTIQARDLLVHPIRGMFQIMFSIDLSKKGGTINCDKINPPEINSKPIDLYVLSPGIIDPKSPTISIPLSRFNP